MGTDALRRAGGWAPELTVIGRSPVEKIEGGSLAAAGCTATARCRPLPVKNQRPSLSRLLGHSNTGVTQDTYIHISDARPSGARSEPITEHP